jgi:hypothetical protein
MIWIREQEWSSFLASADGVWVMALILLVERQAEEWPTHQPSRLIDDTVSDRNIR